MTTTTTTKIIVLGEKHGHLGGSDPTPSHLTPTFAGKNEFTEGIRFVFRGAIDNQCLDLDGAKLDNGTMIHVWGANGWANQYWRAFEKEPGNPEAGHRIQSTQQKTQDSPHAMTMENNFQNHKVVIKDWSGEPNQVWRLVKVAGTDHYHIINYSSGRALSNNGTKFNCRCVILDDNDLNQQWKVERHNN